MATLVRPKIDLEVAKKVVFDLYGLNVTRITALNGYDDKNFHILVAKNIDCDGYVLKVVNNLDSLDEKAFHAQTELLVYLNNSDIRCSKPFPTKNGKPFEIISLPSGKHVVRLLEYIAGDILFQIKNPKNYIFFQVGVLAAKMDNALQKFDHPAYHKTIPWCLSSAPDILNYLHSVNEKQQVLVKQTINEFSSRVLINEDKLDKGIIHGDINEQNLIVETENEKTKVTSVIDFGDTHYCCYLYELALAMMYMIVLANDIEAGGHVLAGYLSVRPMREEDINLLKICVMARFCQSLVLGAHASLQDPGNDYVLITAKKGWGLLKQLAEESEAEVLRKWKNIYS
ncbi:unnamed protein product [Ceutorhynchus assimilis]|uniref:Hydroxylysine kinase n=1 Tax=Ceutorhynchus assimilis TaxID=467358 RepID=A0A9N9QI81_9CUCU|nr:unnamed protein product [Ceutorhynchus assimilis]